MIERIKKQSPARIIALGFALVILVGSLLLMLPCSIHHRGHGTACKFKRTRPDP